MSATCFESVEDGCIYNYGMVRFTITVWYVLHTSVHQYKQSSRVVCFLLGNSPASEFYMPTFRNTLFHLHRQVGK
jgi:hypothetical protein